MIDVEKIIVCTNGGLVTGGAELLHQLVDTLREMGHEANIAYYPFDKSFSCPETYKKYNSPQIDFNKVSDAFYIVPETATWILKRIPHTNAAVWWLSVDNYYFISHQSWFVDSYNRYKSLLRCRLPLNRLKIYKHFVQSKYAEDFLTKAGISSLPLSDYLSVEHIMRRDMKMQRRDIIAYNPKKGQKQTKKLLKNYPNIEFVPIENMTSQQVTNLLASAKIYIDFGHHPGKDRLPREAVMAGCCIITGRQGSANYFEDVSIPDVYKLNDNNYAYLQEFGPLVKSIFENHKYHSELFNSYRDKIIMEPAIFTQQITSIFG